MGRQGRERIARDFSLAAYTGLFARLFRSLARLVIESPSAWRQIFVRMEIYFCAYKKNSMRTKISRLPHSALMPCPTGYNFPRLTAEFSC